MSSTRGSIHHRARSSSGFSLIELIVAVAIMAVLAGAAVPVTSKVLTYKARQATTNELQTLSDASAAYFRDTNELPSDVADLLVKPKSVSGWTGPYLPGVVTDSITGLSGYQVDAWSRAYTTQVKGDVLTLTSMGEDAKKGSAIDVSIALDVTSIRREQTVGRLKTINQAITLYNESYQKSDPLPASWTNALAKLVSKGLLPNSLAYQVDAWGDAYQEEPKGSTPVVEATSSNLGTSSSSSSSSSSGKSKKPKKPKKK